MSWFEDDAVRTVRVEADLGGASRAVAEMGAALAALSKPAADSAAVLERAFARSFDVLEAQILRTTRTGEFSFRAMVDAVIADLSRIAVQSFITAPLEGFLAGLFDFGGARAMGGPVAPGRSYLVGIWSANAGRNCSRRPDTERSPRPAGRDRARRSTSPSRRAMRRVSSDRRRRSPRR